MDNLIINLALTGTVFQRNDTPHLPLTPEEIARDCARAAALGVAIFHLHARDREGRPTWQPEVYREIIRQVRHLVPEAIICVSTSGRIFHDFHERAAVLELDGNAKPDMASLTLGSHNFSAQASVNDPGMILALAERMRKRGIKPELEIFDLGMMDFAHYLIRKDILRPPFYYNLMLGSRGTLAATPDNLVRLTGSLPQGAVWAGAGLGRYQFFVNSMAVTMGGNVRVGLEDNLYLDREKKVLATNEDLVRRIVRVAEAVGRHVASPPEARRLLGLSQAPRLSSCNHGSDHKGDEAAPETA
jgi:3-keto-5-aminohexanoate cleavage enzyme